MEVIDERKSGLLDKIREHPKFKKLKKIKNLQIIVAIFIIAVALLIYSSVMTSKSSESGGAASNQSTLMDEEEQRLSSILGGIDGAGKVNVMITRNKDEIVGVLVIAEGADNYKVLLRLLDATTTALGVDKQIVDVYRMK